MGVALVGAVKEAAVTAEILLAPFLVGVFVIAYPQQLLADKTENNTSTPCKSSARAIWRLQSMNSRKSCAENPNTPTRGRC